MLKITEQMLKDLKLIEGMTEAFVKAGATPEEAKEIVKRITKNTVLDINNLFENIDQEQANKNK
tara:strand:- start:368 stop:559 length:192 start_codon:yes stop_codon:yes gene_type:complete